MFGSDVTREVFGRRALHWADSGGRFIEAPRARHEPNLRDQTSVDCRSTSRTGIHKWRVNESETENSSNAILEAVTRVKGGTYNTRLNSRASRAQREARSEPKVITALWVDALLVSRHKTKEWIEVCVGSTFAANEKSYRRAEPRRRLPSQRLH